MRYAVRGALLAFMLGMGACASGARTDEFTAADTDAIRKRSQQLPAAFNAKQIDAIVELYAENSVFMPPNAPLLRGRDPLREFYQELMARTTNLRLETDDVAGHGPLAYETGTYWLNHQDGAVRDRCKYMFVWRKMGDTWRTEKTIWSSDLPPVPAEKPK